MLYGLRPRIGNCETNSRPIVVTALVELNCTETGESWIDTQVEESDKSNEF